MFNLDWSYWANDSNVVVAASYNRRVGQITAEFIKLLEQEFGVTREYMHAIGFSLGGQVSRHLMLH